MKTKLIPISLLGFCLLFLLACTKKELLNKDTAHIVRLTIQGNSADTLEYVIDNKVLATVGGNFKTQTVIGFDNGQKELRIRKKSSGAVIQTKVIPASPFDQTFTLYYDGAKAYDKVVLLQIQGYALSGELEFSVVGGNLLYTGTGSISQSNIQILIDENSTREIQVRKKGETAVLLSKTLTSAPDRQTLNFFFDGTSIVDNVQLKPPANPANMLISAKFQGSFAPVYYRGVDVDLIFYARNIATGVATKITPEIRFTLPANGTFNDIELPPLTNAKDFVYSCDIVEKGTNNLPYTAAATVAPFILAIYPYQSNVGRYGSPITFEAGKSKLFVIGDGKFIKTTIPRSTSLSITVTDLSQYFK